MITTQRLVLMPPAFSPATNKAGVIAGAVIGAILLLLLLLLLIWLLICCCHKRRYEKEVANEIRYRTGATSRVCEAKCEVVVTDV